MDKNMSIGNVRKLLRLRHNSGAKVDSNISNNLYPNNLRHLCQSKMKARENKVRNGVGIIPSTLMMNLDVTCSNP